MEYIGQLNPTPPYRLELLLAILNRYQHAVTDIGHDGAYWRVLCGTKGRALARVVTASDGQALDVYVAFRDAAITDDWVLNQLRHILGVDVDLRPFYAFAQERPPLWQVVAPLVGLPQHRAPSVFEATILTIIEQQIAWVAAQRAQSWLVRWAGDPLWHNGRPYYAFPTPQQVAGATIEMLMPLKITFRRIQTMITIARQVVAGALDIEAIGAMPPSVAYQMLTTIAGIGHWTATWILTRTMGAQNYVGYNDVALQAAVNHYYEGRAGRATPQQVESLFSQWGAYGGLAAYYTITRWVLDRYMPPNGNSS